MVVGIGLLNLKIESVVVAPSVGIVRRMMVMMVIVVVMIGGKKEARLVIVHGLEMETRRRISREALRVMGIGGEIGIETVETSIKGREKETGTLKETEGIEGVRVKERKSVLSEAEVDPKGIKVIWIMVTEREVVIGNVETEKETEIRIIETEE
jgi:hypothetical protein